jgi:hypothetical protein
MGDKLICAILSADGHENDKDIDIIIAGLPIVISGSRCSVLANLK